MDPYTEEGPWDALVPTLEVGPRLSSILYGQGPIDLRRKSDETKKGMNCMFVNELQAHCLKAFSEEMDRSTWSDEAEEAFIKKAAQSSDIPFVQVDLPGVELDGKSFGPITVKVLTEQIGSSVLWLAGAEPDEFGVPEGSSPFI